MTLTLDLDRQEAERLSVAAHKQGIRPSELAKQIVTDHLPPLELPPVVDEENAIAIHLLQGWLKDEATADPEELKEAEVDLAEFKQNLNVNRANTEERPIFL
jgi:hypothetical protein